MDLFLIYPATGKGLQIKRSLQSLVYGTTLSFSSLSPIVFPGRLAKTPTGTDLTPAGAKFRAVPLGDTHSWSP